MYQFEETAISSCVPDKFRMKVPNIFICDEGAYNSTIGLAVAGWVLRVPNVVPPRNEETEDETGGRRLAAHSHHIGRFASSAIILPSGEPMHCCML